MNPLSIELETTWVLPGGVVRGWLGWQCRESLEQLAVRLLWYTEGRGARDVGLVADQIFRAKEPAGRITFEFVAPVGPYSFVGRLVTLHWVVEATGEACADPVRAHLVLAPTPEPVQLYQGETGEVPG